MVKVQCAVLDDYQGVALSMADWSAIGDQVDVKVFRHHFDHEDALVEAIRDCEMVVAMRERTPFRSSLFDKLPNLKLLITTGMRNAAIDLVAASQHGVVVCGTQGSSQATSELTWALILGLAKHVVQENQALRANGSWQSTVSVDLEGKQLGLLGLGRIGSQVARVGQAFGMHVNAWSQNLTEDHAESLGVKRAASKEDLLKQSDFVSIHLVLSERTRDLVAERELQLMKPSAYLINTSRAPIVNRQALLRALEERWIAGAGLDVFDVEPLPTDDAFRSLPNVLATPHIGYVSETTYRTWYRDAVEDIQAFLAGSPVRQLS